jgi:transposase
MPRAGPKKTQRYSLEFKRTAVQLSQRPGMQVQVVAEALDIHPFMLSRWRKEFREGRLKPSRLTPAKPRASKAPLVRELRRLQALEDAHRVLQEEHALLKKAIRFCSVRRPRHSRSSTRSGGRSQ